MNWERGLATILKVFRQDIKAVATLNGKLLLVFVERFNVT